MDPNRGKDRIKLLNTRFWSGINSFLMRIDSVKLVEGDLY